MPEQLTICNTSPLLYLHQINKLDLLRQLYQVVWFPPAVEAELDAGAEMGINVPRLSLYPWLNKASLASDASIPLVTDLGRGEAEVIALGLEVHYASPSLGPVCFGWEGAFEVDGREIALHDLPRFDNPYCQCAFLSPQVEIQRGTENVVLDLEHGPSAQPHT